MQLVAEADLFQCLFGPRAPLGLGNARERERQLDVLQYRLVRDEVVALEHKADAVIAVAVPVAVAEFARGCAGDDKIAFGILVQTADDV